MDPNHDPRDEKEVRPQVGFRLKVDSFDSRNFFDALRFRAGAYHDMMVFDAVGGEVPGTIRFSWDTPPAVVNDVAEWLQGLPSVIKVFPGYGGPIPLPNEEL